jgi:hemerythrin-like metal-binding protein
MLNFEWKKEFDVGNEQIDAHHKRIIGLTGKLYEAVKIGQEIVVVEEILESLTKYAHTHFTAEEQLFVPTAYPDSKMHMALHQEFCAKLERLKEFIHKKDTLTGLELMEFLTSWFVNHILQIDKQMVPYLHTTPSPASSAPSDMPIK